MPDPLRPEHCVAVPVIVPGCEGVPGATVTASVLAALVAFAGCHTYIAILPVVPVVTFIACSASNSPSLSEL